MLEIKNLYYTFNLIINIQYYLMLKKSKKKKKKKSQKERRIKKS